MSPERSTSFGPASTATTAKFSALSTLSGSIFSKARNQFNSLTTSISPSDRGRYGSWSPKHDGYHFKPSSEEFGLYVYHVDDHDGRGSSGHGSTMSTLGTSEYQSSSDGETRGSPSIGSYDHKQRPQSNQSTRRGQQRPSSFRSLGGSTEFGPGRLRRMSSADSGSLEPLSALNLLTQTSTITVRPMHPAISYQKRAAKSGKSIESLESVEFEDFYDDDYLLDVPLSPLGRSRFGSSCSSSSSSELSESPFPINEFGHIAQLSGADFEDVVAKRLGYPSLATINLYYELHQSLNSKSSESGCDGRGNGGSGGGDGCASAAATPPVRRPCSKNVPRFGDGYEDACKFPLVMPVFVDECLNRPSKYVTWQFLNLMADAELARWERSAVTNLRYDSGFGVCSNCL